MRISKLALLFWSMEGLAGGSAFTPPGLLFQDRACSSMRNMHVLHETSRRDALFKGASAALPLLGTQSGPKSVDAVETLVALLADLPMVRLKLPKQAFGRDYVAIQLNIQGHPFDFMLDTGLSTEIITPHLQQEMGIRSGKSNIQGVAAGGSSSSQDIVLLEGASLSLQNGDELALPPLTAIITDFPQEHLDPNHNVEGMLGMELLSLFDVDFDFPNGRVRLYKPGKSPKDNMVEIPAAVLNETGLIGIRLVSTNKQQQPVLAFLDCGSTFSAVNWSAAQFLGLPPRDSELYKKSPSIVGIGLDGRPMQMPTSKVQLSFRGNAVKGANGVQFESPPPEWKPWDAVQVAIGDLPAFVEMLGDGTKPYTGPAALIGLDVLAQRRVILEAGGKGRARRVFVEPSK